MKKIISTLQLMLYAILPRERQKRGLAPSEPVPSVTGGVMRVEPRDLHLGIDRFLDGEGELRVLFCDCLSLAAPFVLFRLKRQGFSRCTVTASAGGLLVEARR